MTGRGQGIDYVSIIPDDNTSGRVSVNHYATLWDYVNDIKAANAEIMFALMGFVAENRHTGKYATPDSVFADMDSFIADMDSSARDDLAATLDSLLADMDSLLAATMDSLRADTMDSLRAYFDGRNRYDLVPTLDSLLVTLDSLLADTDSLRTCLDSGNRGELAATLDSLLADMESLRADMYNLCAYFDGRNRYDLVPTLDSLLVTLDSLLADTDSLLADMESLYAYLCSGNRDDLAATPDSLFADMESCNWEDFVDARKVAADLHGEGTGRAHRFLLTRARWTADLVADDKVWTAINTLADALLVTPCMGGKQASSIMRKAWPSKWCCPILDCGRVWRKRLDLDDRQYNPNMTLEKFLNELAAWAEQARNSTSKWDA